jgi:hypothetical protein
MKSPFPGMDPYLEQHWRDVHQSLVVYTRDRLRPQLPGNLRARVEERVFVETDEGSYHVCYPDVHRVEYPRGHDVAVASDAAVAVAEPFVIHLHDDPCSQGYLEIIDVGTGNHVVTVIEFLSPSNKLPGEGQELYLRKQREVRAAKASLVEVDLTRVGRRVLVAPPEKIPQARQTAYQACVTRGWKPEIAMVYPIPLAQRLPVIPIPLRETDKDVTLDLQALIEQCYANGGYDNLDYRAEPVPPLEPADAAWAGEWLQSKGLR